MIDPFPEAAANDGDENDPVAILFQLLVTLLMPLFLTGPATSIDIARARLAASAALDGYKALTIPELISVAQIISFSISALGSLALSMMDDISTTMLLQLRGNANALSRSEMAHQRTLDRSRQQKAQAREKRLAAMQEQARQQQQARDAEAHGLTQEAIAASVAEAQKMAAEAKAKLQPQPPAPAPSVPPTVPTATTPAAKRLTPSIAANPAASIPLPQRPMTPAEDHQRKLAWGTAMATVAAEFAAAASTSPEEQRLNELRAAALSTVACQLLGDAAPPPAEPHIAPPAEPPDNT